LTLTDVLCGRWSVSRPEALRRAVVEMARWVDVDSRVRAAEAALRSQMERDMKAMEARLVAIVEERLDGFGVQIDALTRSQDGREQTPWAVDPADVAFDTFGSPAAPVESAPGEAGCAERGAGAGPPRSASRDDSPGAGHGSDLVVGDGALEAGMSVDLDEVQDHQYVAGLVGSGAAGEPTLATRPGTGRPLAPVERLLSGGLALPDPTQ